jgi:hypothetical protein
MRLASLRSGLVSCWLAIFAAGSLSSPALAQLGENAAKESVVYIQITGDRKDGGTAIQAQEGTGFFIGNEGQILTVYHLLEPFKDAKPDSILIKFSIGEKKKENLPEQADVISAMPHLDLMLLQMHIGTKKPKGLTLGSAADISEEDRRNLFSSGFPTSLNDPTIDSPEQLVSTQNTGGTTWLLKGTVEGGRSGSPIYNKKGFVVGVMKGQAGQSTGAFIPIDFADPLFMALRLRQLREEQKAVLGPLKAQIDEQIKKYVADHLAADGAQVMADAIEKYVKNNPARIASELEREVDSYRRKVVSNSYSASFYFPLKAESKDREYRILKFYKTDEDTAELKCEIIWPFSVTANNKIMLTVNNDLELDGLARPKEKNSDQLVQIFEKENWKMHAKGKPQQKYSDYQQLAFSVEYPLKSKEEKGNISVNCTLLVMGPTKYRESSQ